MEILRNFVGLGFGRIRLIHKLWQNYFVLRYPSYKWVNGYKMTTRVPREYITSGFYYGKYEREELNLFLNSIKDGDVVLDCGSHMGYYALAAAKKVGESGRVYAFEPLKDNFIILLNNIKLNLFRNIVAENKAVADKSTMYPFFRGPYTTDSQIEGSSHLIRAESKEIDMSEKNKIYIEGVSLDNYIKNKQGSLKVDVIKIDVEGAEERVLKGARNIIKNNPRIKIFIEITMVNGKIPEYISNLIEKEGFKKIKISDNLRGALDFMLVRINDELEGSK